MKKTLLSICMGLIALVASAQTDESFSFCTADGTVIGNGSVINVTEGHLDELFDVMIFESGIYVKYNVAGYAGVRLNISRIDNGRFQHCFPASCQSYTSARIDTCVPNDGTAAGTVKSLQSEWFPVEDGMVTVTYTLLVYERDASMNVTQTAEGPSITVNFCNNVYPANVNAVTATNGDGKAYNLQGQRVDDSFRGVVISNGKKTVK